MSLQQAFFLKNQVPRILTTYVSSFSSTDQVRRNLAPRYVLLHKHRMPWNLVTSSKHPGATTTWSYYTPFISLPHKSCESSFHAPSFSIVSAHTHSQYLENLQIELEHLTHALLQQSLKITIIQALGIQATRYMPILHTSMREYQWLSRVSRVPWFSKHNP